MVLAVLVAAGLYMPRHNKTEAKNSAMANPGGDNPVDAPKPNDIDAVTPNQPAPSMTPEGGATSPPAGENAAGTQAQPAETTQPPPQTAPATSPRHVDGARSAATPKLSAKSHVPSPRTSVAEPEPDTTAGETAPAAAPKDTAALDELEHEVDLLSNRAAAVNSGLDRLQQAQSSSGYGLRGDMVAKQSSMKNNLSKAQDAIERGDVQRAKKFADMAQGDVETLEHFLGR